MRYLGCIGLVVLLPLGSFAGQQQKMGGKTVDEWLKQLDDKDAKKQAEAAQFLGDFGADAKTAAKPLAALLKHDDKNLRLQAATALSRIGPQAKEAIPNLLAAIKDKEPEVALRAMVALGNMGPAAKEAVPELLGVAQGRSKEKVLTALAALGRIGVADKTVVDTLQATLGDPEVEFKVGAALALADLELGQEAVRAALVKALADKSSKVFAVALRNALRWHEAGPIPVGTEEALLHLLKNKEAEGRHRLWAVQVVGHLPAPADLPALRAALKDHDPLVRLQTAADLARDPAERREALRVLLLGLEHEEAAVRAHAIEGLVQALSGAKPAEEANEALAALKKRLLDPSPLVRRHAAVALVVLAGEVKEGLPILLTLLADKQQEIRGEAARSLGKLGEKVVGEALQPLLDILDAGKTKEVSAFVRGCAAESLGRVATPDKAKDVLQALAANDKEPASVRTKARFALVRLHLAGPKEEEGIKHALQGRDTALAAMTIALLRDLSRQQAAAFLPTLTGVLQHPEPNLRQAAWYTLQHLLGKAQSTGATEA
jgi:HEAT repeat protein